MDGYVADWNRDYFIDKYARKLIVDFNEEYIYNLITDKLKQLSNLDLEDEINNYDPDIILGDI